MLVMKAQLAHELSREQRAQKKNEAQRALEAVWTLFSDFEYLANIQINLNEQFTRAANEGHADFEPWQKVLGIIHSDYQQAIVSVSQISFLIDAKKAPLLSEVKYVQSRVLNLSEAVVAYNSLRSDLLSYMEQKQSKGEVIEGNLVQAGFDPKDEFIISAKAGAAQSVLGTILEFLETDVDVCWKVMISLKQAAEDYFGDDFPSFKMERAGKC
ncbi:hypothetical protein PRI8871_02715 [Pseudoprimorskyibacter insulae]|uniref:Uncharacterized protein n=2 Tax=Pseudoprimorskyibacter insulae TaxID=1695997 RepID=A0A2R8AXX9_9RHOB|nr:hypothetical protein PRI8871_02715 [Pseudoprimorskyibacter insulae]